jgi:hypothetical protein
MRLPTRLAMVSPGVRRRTRGYSYVSHIVLITVIALGSVVGVSRFTSAVRSKLKEQGFLVQRYGGTQ